MSKILAVVRHDVMTPTECFPRQGLALLARLKSNNTASWFRDHKEEYRALVREPMAAIVAAINIALARFAPVYVNAKKDPLSRPNRDVRFSKDKSPYRTDISAVFPRQGLEKHQAAGFFVRIGPDGVELIAGSFMPGPDELRVIRGWLAGNHEAFRRLTAGRAVTAVFGPLQGDRLVRVPAPYPADHPAGDLLRLKQFYYRRALPARAATSPRLVRDIISAFRAATPFVEGVDRALGNG